MNVCARSSPICAQTSGGSGSVAIMCEYTGATSRRDPGRCAVQASVARTTQRARTMPWSVTTARGDRRRARVPSASRAPRDRTTSSSPRTSRAGLDPGAVGRERAADRTVGADVLGDPVGVEQVRLVAPPGVGGDVVGDALQLRAVAGDA